MSQFLVAERVATEEELADLVTSVEREVGRAADAMLVELPEGYMDFGCAQIALRVDGGYVTASDPRRDSLAVGF